jgi:quercetin dioxygenase-like cupin family protein
MSGGTNGGAEAVICAAGEQSFAVVGTVLQFVTSPEQCGSDLSVMRCGVPGGAVIPLHSHSDPEVFYLLDGNVDVFQYHEASSGWPPVSRGEVVTIASGVRHALRNLNSTPAISVLISQARLYHFFRELAQPINPGDQPPRPSPEVMKTLLALAAKYDFWVGSPSENAAIGISIE